MTTPKTQENPSLLGRLIDAKPGELAPVLWASAYFFCVMASWFILRPIRDEAGIAGGIRNLPWLFTGTMIAMLVVSPAFAALVAKLPRKRFVPIAYRFFLVNLVVFFALFTAFPEPPQQVWVGRAFYLWASVFNLFVVSVFWGFGVSPGRDRLRQSLDECPYLITDASVVGEGLFLVPGILRQARRIVETHVHHAGTGECRA